MHHAYATLAGQPCAQRARWSSIAQGAGNVGQTCCFHECTSVAPDRRDVPALLSPDADGNDAESAYPHDWGRAARRGRCSTAPGARNVRNPATGMPHLSAIGNAASW